MNDFFISYSRHDSEVVHDIASRLRLLGYTVWIDVNGIESGDAFRSIIVNAISESRIVLFFSSQSSNNSPFVIGEISLAKKYEKRIIPIKLDTSEYNTELILDLVNLDYIDLQDTSQISNAIVRITKTLDPSAVQPNSKGNATKGNSSNFKFYLKYKGCLLSITLCLFAVIVIPQLFMASSLGDQQIAPSRPHGYGSEPYYEEGVLSCPPERSSEPNFSQRDSFENIYLNLIDTLQYDNQPQKQQ